MNDIQDSGVNQQLVRRLGIADTPMPSSSLAPEVFPVIIVAPPSQEDDLLRGVFRSGGSGYQGATPAQYTHIKLANIAGSGILVLVDELLMLPQTSCIWSYGLYANHTALANFHTTGCYDSRIIPTTVGRQSAAVLTSETNISPPFAVGGKRLAYNQGTISSRVLDIGAVVQPGHSFGLDINDVNIAAYFMLKWRERRAQPSELV